MKRMSGGWLLAAGSSAALSGATSWTAGAACPWPPVSRARAPSHHPPIPARRPATRLGGTGALRALAIWDDDDGRAMSIGLEEGKADRRLAVDEDAFDHAVELAGDPASAPVAADGEHAAAADIGRRGETRELRHGTTPIERIWSAPASPARSAERSVARRRQETRQKPQCRSRCRSARSARWRHNAESGHGKWRDDGPRDDNPCSALSCPSRPVAPGNRLPVWRKKTSESDIKSRPIWRPTHKGGIAAIRRFAFRAAPFACIARL